MRCGLGSEEGGPLKRRSVVFEREEGKQRNLEAFALGHGIAVLDQKDDSRENGRVPQSGGVLVST